MPTLGNTQTTEKFCYDRQVAEKIFKCFKEVEIYKNAIENPVLPEQGFFDSIWGKLVIGVVGAGIGYEIGSHR
jgi:hypothetical protein